MNRAERQSALQAPLAWTIASLACAVSLQVTRLPLWVTLVFVLLAGWRILLSLRGASLPPRLLRHVAVVAIVIAVLVSYRTLNGLNAGTALLVLMAALKLLETRAPRDHVVLLVIAYYLVLAAFLYNQSLWLLPLQAAIIWLTTTALLRVTQTPGMFTAPQSLRFVGRLLLQALPLMLLLFILFPRLPGPLWALPGTELAASGLSDSMSPGDVSELSLQSTPAFRVRFHGPVPPPVERYWRGPVLHEFDGHTWNNTRGIFNAPGTVSHAGTAFEYDLMLEPSGGVWVFALDLVESWPQPQMRRASDYQLLSTERINQPRTISLRSRTRYQAGVDPVTSMLRRDTRLPPGRNPRTLEFAQRLRAEAASPTAYIQAVLRTFREQKFYYTLQPPRLDFNSVDDFLFNTREGFCEHFASAFTALMRAAGIPARVVTGYQGGEFNRMGGYFIVRQSDAHAWSEVWLEGRGWVRVDPTAAVAPERIERGVASMSEADEAFANRLLRNNAWLADIRFAWDAVNTVWREHVIDFSSRSQENLLRWLGLARFEWRALTALLVLGLGVVLTLLALQLRRELKIRNPDPILRAYRSFCRRLERRGLRRPPHEGPLDFARRIAQLQPEIAAESRAIIDLYIALRYGNAAPVSATAELRERIRRIPP